MSVTTPISPGTVLHIHTQCPLLHQYLRVLSSTSTHNVRHYTNISGYCPPHPHTMSVTTPISPGTVLHIHTQCPSLHQYLRVLSSTSTHNVRHYTNISGYCPPHPHTMSVTTPISPGTVLHIHTQCPSLHQYLRVLSSTSTHNVRHYTNISGHCPPHPHTMSVTTPISPGTVLHILTQCPSLHQYLRVLSSTSTHNVRHYTNISGYCPPHPHTMSVTTPISPGTVLHIHTQCPSLPQHKATHHIHSSDQLWTHPRDWVAL